MEPSAQSSPTLLIVEDEKELQDLLVEELAPVGCKILKAGNGREAIQIITQHPNSIDAILSDIHMPEMNGLEFVRELRKMGEITPLVFLSGYGNKQRAVEAMKWITFDFIDKPYQRDQLIQTVRDALDLGVKLRPFSRELHLLLHEANQTHQRNSAIQKAQMIALLLQKWRDGSAPTP